jgi:MFS family permease
MIVAVSMTFIDQTIVAIAAPQIQRELGLSSTGVQWAINAYLLTLAALFAFGGRLADTRGHKKMTVLGVIVFAGASAMCGLTPKGGAAEAWIVTFRAVQGAGGALMLRGRDWRSSSRPSRCTRAAARWPSSSASRAV